MNHFERKILITRTDNFITILSPHWFAEPLGSVGAFPDVPVLEHPNPIHHTVEQEQHTTTDEDDP